MAIFNQVTPGQERRKQLADSMLQQGTTFKPQRTPLAAVAQLAQALSGRAQASAVDKEIKEGNEKTRADMQSAFSQHGNDIPGLAQALMQMENPGLAELGMGLQTQNLSNQANQETFEPVLDESGNPVGQRSSTSGKVIADPRAPSAPGESPSSVREYEYRKSLPGGIGGEADKAFLEGKRQLQFLNLGDRFQGVGTAADDQALDINLTPDKTLEYIEESTIAKKRAEGQAGKEANQTKVEGSLAQKTAQTEVLSREINEAIDMTSNATAGFGGAVTSKVPGTPAHDLGQKLNTIRANIGFDKLQEMRENSPTGGALGQVSEMENKLLQAVWGSVEQSQSPEQLRENLRRLDQQVQESWQRVFDAYEKDYGQVFTDTMKPETDQDTNVIDWEDL